MNRGEREDPRGWNLTPYRSCSPQRALEDRHYNRTYTGTRAWGPWFKVIPRAQAWGIGLNPNYALSFMPCYFPVAKILFQKYIQGCPQWFRG